VKLRAEIGANKAKRVAAVVSSGKSFRQKQIVEMKQKVLCLVYIPMVLNKTMVKSVKVTTHQQIDVWQL
jgi:hypothetical protein